MAVPKGSPELTTARREEIIAACETLYRTMSFKDITIRDIGNMTSFGRTSIYTYFQTKEEIFLAILQREYEAWIAELDALAQRQGECCRRDVACGLAKTLERRDLLLKIMSMNHFDMEQNSREENLVEFKIAYGNSMRAVIRCLDRFCPEMTAAEQQDFLYAFFPFMYGIYPYTAVTDKQKRAMERAGVKYVYQSVYEITRTFLNRILGVTAEQ